MPKIICGMLIIHWKKNNSIMLLFFFLYEKDTFNCLAVGLTDFHLKYNDASGLVEFGLELWKPFRLLMKMTIAENT